MLRQSGGPVELVTTYEFEVGLVLSDVNMKRTVTRRLPLLTL